MRRTVVTAIAAVVLASLVVVTLLLLHRSHSPALGGLPLPPGARLQHSGTSVGFQESEYYALVTMDRQAAVEFLKSIQAKGRVSCRERMVPAPSPSRPDWWRPDIPHKFVAMDMNSTRILIDMDDPQTAQLFVWRIQ